MKEMWDERYRSLGYAYGREPNVFLKGAFAEYKPGKKMLFPADGEGRNSVYAASLGHDVYAFDLSEKAREKALRLADERRVSIEYKAGDFRNLDYKPESFDAAALIYAHFPPDLISEFHKKIGTLIRSGGLLILEGFSKNNLPLREKNPKVGGPKNPEMLFSTGSIRADFPGFEILQLEEAETELNEGEFHQGLARVIRFVGKKK